MTQKQKEKENAMRTQKRSKIFILTCILLWGICFAAGGYAAVPTSPPVFSDPLNFTNLYQPFHIGTEKYYSVQQGHTDEEVMDIYLDQMEGRIKDGT